jgi:mannose-6-phosphate isomerase-like protein (cupin superfamily)
MTDWVVPLARFEEELGNGGAPYWQGLSHGTMRTLLFKPKGRDVQQPHGQDEIYIVHSGSGTFSKSGEMQPVQAGDVIFVEAGAEHRFETFSDDFATWVIFWGPEGGEGKAG